MAPCLSKLPSVCLESIFKHVPLSDLYYSVGLVCSSWYISRRTELIRRRRLVLVTFGKHENFNDYHTHLFSNGTELVGRVRRDDGSLCCTLESLDQIKFNSLTVPGDIHIIPFIASLTNFHNITRLYLSLNCSDWVLTQVIRLIDHFSDNLAELKLFNSNTEPDTDSEVDDPIVTQELADTLFAYLNGLHSLKHLQLDLVLSNVHIAPEQLLWLSRLSTLAIRTYGSGIEEDWVFAALNQYAHNLTVIEFYNTVSLNDVTQIDAQLCTKFTAFSVSYGRLFETMLHHDAMRQFCERFSALAKLELHLGPFSMPMAMLARYLSLLSQLVYVDLHFDDIPQGQEEQGGGEHDEQITQVSSVRLLSLHYITNTHHESEHLFIPETFPNLQVLHLDHSFAQCRACEIAPRRFRFGRSRTIIDPERTHRITECARFARKPFRRCVNLHTVALGSNETLIALDDL